MIYLTTYSATPRTMKMAQSMAERGHPVELLEWDRDGTKPRYEKSNGLTIRRLRLKSPYGLRAVIQIPVWWLFAFVWILSGNYSVVQARNLDTFFPIYLAAKLKKVRIVYDLADVYGDTYALGVLFLRPLIRLLDVACLENSDAIVMASEGQMSQLDWSPSHKNWMVFYNVPMDPIPNLKRDARNGRNLTLLYAGTFAIDRVRLLVNVARAIEDLPTTLVVAGFGEYAETVRSLLQGKATIFGKLPQQEVLRLTATSDVVLLPLNSALLNYRIALANKFFEAMCCGAVILAPKGTLMGEIVEKERIGLVVDYKDVDEIRRAISWIASNDDEVARIRERAVDLFYSRFNPRVIQNRYLTTVEPLFNQD